MGDLAPNIQLDVLFKRNQNKSSLQVAELDDHIGGGQHKHTHRALVCIKHAYSKNPGRDMMCSMAEGCAVI